MRKLKLQMQITVDGFMAGPEGQLDWMTFDMDEKLLAFINTSIRAIEHWRSLPRLSFSRR